MMKNVLLKNIKSKLNINYLIVFSKLRQMAASGKTLIKWPSF
uniref:Uncharacterized protein n=1 Tax=Anguilla anguilla TaxID=7936 RepID=A0A0E9SQN8_ANGAN